MLAEKLPTINSDERSKGWRRSRQQSRVDGWLFREAQQLMWSRFRSLNGQSWAASSAPFMHPQHGAGSVVDLSPRLWLPRKPATLPFACSNSIAALLSGMTFAPTEHVRSTIDLGGFDIQDGDVVS